MFPKPAFGANTSGFGTFSSNAAGTSPFGFKPTTGTSAFGAPPAFGATSTQPATGGGLFGASTQSPLFGNTTAAPAPAFGATNTGFGGFGASTSAAGGLFNTPTAGGGLFGGTQNTSAFGAKPAGFGFATTPTAGQTGGLFGATAAPATTGLFGQQSASTLGAGSGLFSSNTTFGQTQPQQAGTGHVKYNPVVGTDVVVKSGASQNINIKHHCITCMKEYESKSLEELRLEDYTAGRKGPQAGGAMFGGFQQPTETKPLFGGTGTFGAPATTTATSVFGGGGITGGTAFGGNNSFSFGSNAQNTANSTGGLFGATKPAFGASTAPATGLFGATTTQAAPTFGTTTPSFGFGSNTQNQTGGLFGSKPAATTFGTGNTTTGFGGFGNTGTTLFGANKPQTAAPAFGTGAPAFGSLSGGFGTTTSSAGGGLFGANTTLGKPATTQSAFGGFSTGGTALGTGLGTGLGGNTFGNTSAAPAFGALGNNNMFGGQQQQTNFSGGMGTGLGGGLFNSSSLGGTGLGLGFGANTANISNNTLSGASAAGNVHEQILNLVARPYGDSPLFKDLPPDSSTTAEDALKPTNPAAMKAVLDSGGAYRVTSPAARLKLQLRPAATQHKKSLFDGLEESDASLEDKLTLKPSRKRLVLRPKSLGDEVNGSVDPLENRSLDEQRPPTDGQVDKENDASALGNGGDTRAGKHASTDEQDSGAGKMRWLDNSRQQWSAEKDKPTNVEPTSRPQANSDAEGKPADLSDISERYYRLLDYPANADKEKPIDGEPTPRLYPNLDKEVHRDIPMAERRASWLTTKPLHKPFPPHSNPEAVESSVRDLGVRQDRSQDKENLDSLSASEEEHVAPRIMPPHPTGVKLTRPGYYTIPSLDEMMKYMRPDGPCVVPHLTIGRKNYGSVYYECEIDVAGLDLDSLVFFMNKEVTVYPDDSDKPPVGEGLNRRAIVTLDRVWPRDKTEKRPITDPDRLLAMDYEGKLRRVCDKHDTKFVEYRPETGSWVFRVEHFSKYSLTDSDEEDEITPEVMKRQLVNQQVQKTAPPAPPKPPVAPAPGLGGLGGLGAMSPKGSIGPMGGLSSVPLGPVAGPSPFGDENLYAMHQTSLNLFNGAGKAFEMDTTEDNTESQSLYQDSHRAFGVKSPTSELARLEHRQSHNVQLMKASLYADTEIEDDNMSVSTGDQQVPRGAPLLGPVATATVTSLQHDDLIEMREPVHYPLLATEEIQMKPLIVRPHTIVLKYHRKVPPFKQTIAGRLDAACIADMSVCRARHTRVGFGPSNNMVYATSYDSINDLPKKAEPCELGRYTRGRRADDWSEPVVTRLAVGQGDDCDPMQEIIARQLETLLEYSTLSECGGEQCPRAAAVSGPRERRKALKQLTSHFKGRSGGKQYGVSTSYCHEVFKLCEALWGADLENDGVPGMDEQSIVNRHRRFLEWMTSHVADVTDRELAKPRAGEPEDEQDGHSARIWTLLLGGRVLEACKVAKENGDLNLALLIAQAAGDPTFKSLVARQLSLWRECGADSLISSHKLCTLKLIAGLSTPSDKLDQLDWSRALHAAARYLTPQVPTLERIIRKYESFFVQDESFYVQDASIDSELQVDLSEIDSHAGMGMTFPLPPYVDDYDVTINSNGKQRRVLDLRYEIIRARAMNARPKLHPAAYTPDSMDYSLCFLLGAWFGNPTPESITGMASQLEAADAWHLAVQVLMYHPDDNIRGHLIRDVLSRHAPAKPDSPAAQGRLKLVRKLRIPHKWLLLAQAHRAKYEHLPAIEVGHLVGAEQWNAAHRVLLDELMPDAVLSDNLKSIAPLLEKLNEAAQRHEVSGWESGGQALHLYISVCDEIRGLVARAENADEAERAAVSSRVEGLRSRVAAACRALGRLQPATPAHTAAHAEMGARLVQLALAAGEPAAQLAMLLKALKLPPECTTQAHQKITTELAEQASELCIESPSNSPHSSHHRATVHS